MTITAALLNDLFLYDPITGSLTHKVSRKGVRKGMSAGSLKSDGYIHLKVFGVEYYAHRVIWQMIHGDLMPPMVDHKDRVKSNNILLNLRAATSVQNAANSKSRSDNALGIKGVRKHGNRWRAAITISGKSKHLGIFDTTAQASAAYEQAAIAQYGSFARA